MSLRSTDTFSTMIGSNVSNNYKGNNSESVWEKVCAVQRFMKIYERLLGQYAGDMMLLITSVSLEVEDEQ
jgi:hypothetical protein